MAEVPSFLADLTESGPAPPTKGFVVSCLALNSVLALVAAMIGSYLGFFFALVGGPGLNVLLIILVLTGGPQSEAWSRFRTQAVLLCVTCSLLVPFAYVVFTEAC